MKLIAGWGNTCMRAGEFMPDVRPPAVPHTYAQLEQHDTQGLLCWVWLPLASAERWDVRGARNGSSDLPCPQANDGLHELERWAVPAELS